MPTSAEYAAEVARIAEVARQWVADNPHKKVEIVWRTSDKVQVIGLFADAIKMGFVKVNADGMELLKAMGVDPANYNEPSVIMVRTALDSLEKGKDEP